MQTGYVSQSFLKGADGKLYNASNAPGDLLYSGLYRGFEDTHARWGTTDYHYNPLIGPGKRLENGYMVGRDAGTLVVATGAASLHGTVESSTFQSYRQTRARRASLKGIPCHCTANSSFPWPPLPPCWPAAKTSIWPAAAA